MTILHHDFNKIASSSVQPKKKWQAPFSLRLSFEEKAALKKIAGDEPLRVSAHSIANGVRGCVARLAERGAELRDAAHATRDQLEISEGRRDAVEAELETRELEMDRGMTH
ncbi:hypothetical protein [uncultured Tateyamaria sp.]|uniref:hypothetical protein n=1 Tax=uncultured Tateyamaria sp. TaxID=455651 RepID=UPI00261CF21A|nr:hypothetical protein [uncultured Tateyamaria sp.]